ncbi:MAG: S8 family serine peptidase [Solirubrobacteraceae bacterium]
MPARAPPVNRVLKSILIRVLAPATGRVMLLCALAPVLALMLGAAAARAADYVPGEVLVGYGNGPTARIAAGAANRIGVRLVQSPAPGGEIVRLAPGMTVAQGIAKLRRLPGVLYAVPNYIAREAGSWVPDDPGRAHSPGGWQALQWNFLAADGVNAPEAWANLLADHRAGGRGVVVAVLDTGVAFRNWEQFRKAPDFEWTHFVDPCDLVDGKLVQGRCTNRDPLDRNGHGTFVAGEIAESTNNGRGLTGLAYGASIMPVRILDASGEGDAATISHGIRYAASHGAKVINLSLEFDIGVRAADIPDIISAIGYAHRRGVVVVAAAGNEGASELAYPAADSMVISVGATTADRCLADYSNFGSELDLVAPGGGDDSAGLSDPVCQADVDRNLPSIYQQTLLNPPFSWSRFGYPGGMFGTSMSSPDVAATAALVIASGVIGPNPSADQILKRLEQTARPLGGSQPNPDYGWGLLDAGAATAPITGAAPVAGTRR